MGFSSTRASTLLKVELSGSVTPTLRESTMNLGWASFSSDGCKLAIWKAAGSSNVWLINSHGIAGRHFLNWRLFFLMTLRRRLTSTKGPSFRVVGGGEAGIGLATTNKIR